MQTNKKFYYLSQPAPPAPAQSIWDRLGVANYPVEIGIDKETKNTLFAFAGILAAGAIISVLINNMRS